MLRKILISSALAAGLPSLVAAQTTGRLSRVIPELYGPNGLIVDSLAPLPSGATHSGHFNSAFQSEFRQFNIALASQVASVPIPSPAAGFTYSFDPESGVFVRSTESYGPIFAERAETIGRNKFSFGFNYQHFSFDQIEGIDLGDVPAVFTHDDAAPGGKADVISTHNQIDATVDQFTTFITFGLTDRIDLAVAIPVVSAQLDVTSNATIERIGTVDPKVHFFDDSGAYGVVRTFHNGADASGIGDLHLQAKRSMFDRDGVALALGLDMRFPSGDADNLLGTGALGMRPFAALSASSSLISSHINVSYQWNGKSVLAGDLENRSKEDLPDQFLYAGSVDFAVHERMTLAFTLLGQILIDSPRLLKNTFQALDGKSTFPNIAFDQGTISQTNVAAGIKMNLLDQLLLDVNATIALDDGGLRDKLTPLVGLEYSF